VASLILGGRLWLSTQLGTKCWLKPTLTPQADVILDRSSSCPHRKVKKGGDARVALQWAKTLRDFVELRSATLLNVTAHLLGRDDTGAIVEPPDHYDSDPEFMFERDVQTFLASWSPQGLKLKCEDCGVMSEEVHQRQFPHPYPQETEHFCLCEKCYKKRKAKQS
jgi:hypothetical protein